MPNPMYKHQMPTEVLKDEIAELKKTIDERDEYVKQLEARITELERGESKLAALEAMGVDNWEGYEAAMEEAYE